MKMPLFNTVWNALTSHDRKPPQKTYSDDPAQLSQQEIEELYDNDDIAARIVNLIPSHALKKFVTFEVDLGSSDIYFNTEMLDYCKKQKIRFKVKKVAIYARLYGQGALFINAGDGKQLSEPFSLDEAYTIRNFVPLHRHEFMTSPLNLQQDITQDNFGEPEFYQIMSTYNQGLQSTVHASRMIIFEGVDVSPTRYIQNQYASDSVLVRVEKALQSFTRSHDQLPRLIEQYRLVLLKLHGLAQLVSQKKTRDIHERVELLNKERNMFGSIVLDTEDDFGFSSGGLEGISDVIDRIKSRLQAATDIPHTILFNEAPASSIGSNSGQGEKDDWLDTVEEHQKNYFEGILQRIFEVILNAENGPTEGIVPNNWSFTFEPLKQQSEGEKLDNRKKQAEIDTMYESMQVVDADEIRNSRFNGQYSFETTLDQKFDSKDFTGDETAQS